MTPSDERLTTEQAYEAAYRFVAQYNERERIVPLMLMLTSLRPTPDDAQPMTQQRGPTGSDAFRTHSRRVSASRDFRTPSVATLPIPDRR